LADTDTSGKISRADSEAAIRAMREDVKEDVAPPKGGKKKLFLFALLVVLIGGGGAAYKLVLAKAPSQVATAPVPEPKKTGPLTSITSISIRCSFPSRRKRGHATRSW
jgi:hypothetical protein